MRSFAAWEEKDEADLQAIKLELGSDPALVKRVKEGGRGSRLYRLLPTLMREIAIFKAPLRTIT